MLYTEEKDFYINNDKHVICSCGKWWVSLEHALFDGYEGDGEYSSCDYCRSMTE